MLRCIVLCVALILCVGVGLSLLWCCYNALCRDVSRFVVLCCVMVWYVVLCYAVLCYCILCYIVVVMSYVMVRRGVSCCVVL